MAKTVMSDEHKTALAEGRAQGRAVRAYLEALETNRPKRGRKRTPDSIRARLDAIETEQCDANALQRLQLAQERLDLTAELEQLETADSTDLPALQAGFVAVAADYATRKGITYNALRQVGVPATVLKQAGIPRTS